MLLEHGFDLNLKSLSSFHGHLGPLFYRVCCSKIRIIALATPTASMTSGFQNKDLAVNFLLFPYLIPSSGASSFRSPPWLLYLNFLFCQFVLNIVSHYSSLFNFLFLMYSNCYHRCFILLGLVLRLRVYSS